MTTALLVDPELRRITEIDLPDENKKALAIMRELIGCEGMDYAAVTSVHDWLWCGEDALQRGRCWACRLPGMRNPVAGRFVIVGANDRGEAAPPSITVPWLEANIVWLDEIVPEIMWVTDGAHIRQVVTYSRPK
jgi:hypothetical protein